MDFKSKIDEKANQWLIEENEGLSDAKKIELEQWLENKNHKKSYEENKKIIEECLDLDDEFIKDIENEVLKDTKQNNILYKSKYMIASVVMACIVIFTAFEVNNYFKPSFSQEYIAYDKKLLNISLPDKSIIDLDIKSDIKVSYYKDKRTIEINKGKALFSVTKDKTRPFIVKAGKTLVEVLGTKFEVVKLNNITKINVQEGLVKIGYLYDEEQNKQKTILQLKKAESLTLNSLGKVLNYKQMDPKKVATWKNDIIEFHKTTLKEATNIFERYSNQKVEFETFELSQFKISGKFSTLHYESFLEAITLIYPIKIEKIDNHSIKILKN